MATKKSHDPDLSQATDAPTLRTPTPLGDLSELISSSRDPRPSQWPVDLSAAPRDVQTGQTAAQVLQAVGVPPEKKVVRDESAGPRPTWLA